VADLMQMDAELAAFIRRAARQEQFLTVMDRDTAEATFRRGLNLTPADRETVGLDAAAGRVLADDVIAENDAPPFDRSSVDGFAVRAADTAGADAETPVRLRLNGEVLAAGRAPKLTVQAGTATVIATGGMLPRGADAVVMVEQTEYGEDDQGAWVEIAKPAGPGQFVAAAGSDIGRGDTVLRRGQVLGAREIGMLAAVGRATVAVWRKPQVAILSTGDEITPPGEPLRPGAVYDSNAAVLAAAVTELGCEPLRLGVARDDEEQLTALISQGLRADALILSGGTSKGAGDLTFRIVSRLTDPGVVVHGVALKPGKPLCLAVHHGKPVAVLPGFPTSAMFTFHEFVAPVLRALTGRPPETAAQVEATLPLRIPSERGRTEYVMVSLAQGADGALAAYPLGKGSGAVTAFGAADGFIAVPPQTEAVAAGTPVTVQLIGADVRPADLTIIGSQCLGLDRLIGRLMTAGLRVKVLGVGSMGGLAAARRGECDIAPVHLLDPASGVYNRPFLADGLTLVPGYRRRQGLLFRPGDARFSGKTAEAALAAALDDPACLLMNRNPGSGTRILLDGLLGQARPAGYWSQARSHNAVAAAVAQGRADWGMATEAAARLYSLDFIFVQDEAYDFIIPAARIGRRGVEMFITELQSTEFIDDLARLGFQRRLD
jgi:putative molybdopterin biosynthesis protein